MGAYISRVQIENFRNFKQLDVSFNEKAVIVGENQAGKTNFLYALQLILDPKLPDSNRYLLQEDFWEGLESPMENGLEIKISIEFRNWLSNKSLNAILQKYLITSDPADPIARLTYLFRPKKIQPSEDLLEYEYIIYGGDDETKHFYDFDRKFMPIEVLPALRDAESDIKNWRRSPIRPLIDKLQLGEADLDASLQNIKAAAQSIQQIPKLLDLNQKIEKQVNEMIGSYRSIQPSLQFGGSDASQLLRQLHLYMEAGHGRLIEDESLGICNVMYLTLLLLDIQLKQIMEERAITFLAIEEPEAHLHPHLQRLVFQHFLHQDMPVFLTTHSPHVSSIAPLSSIILIKNLGSLAGSNAVSTQQANLSAQQIEDLERYLDATRSEILYAKGVFLVEGIAELYIIPACAKALGGESLDKWGITVCSVHGTDFLPYVRVLGKKGLDIPFVIVSDGDPHRKDEETLHFRGIKRGIKLLNEINPLILRTLLHQHYAAQDWDSLRSILKSNGIFLNENTLEVTLSTSGNSESMITTLKELGAKDAQITKFRNAISEINDYKKCKLVIRYIENVGKGRYAQRLSPKITSGTIPDYIKEAILSLQSKIRR